MLADLMEAFFSTLIISFSIYFRRAIEAAKFYRSIIQDIKAERCGGCLRGLLILLYFCMAAKRQIFRDQQWVKFLTK